MNVERDGSVIVVDLSGAEAKLTTPEAIEQPIRALDGAVTALERFGLLVLTGGGDKAPRTPAAVRKRWREWLASRDADMERKCRGVAMVTSSPARALLLRLAEPVIRRMFHAPTAAFGDEAAARAWLAEQLRRHPGAEA